MMTLRIPTPLTFTLWLLLILACGDDRPVGVAAAPAHAANPACLLDQICEAPAITAAFDVSVGRLRNGETLATALARLGLSWGQVDEVTRALVGSFDFTKSRPGDQLRLTLREGRLDALEYRASMTREWLLTREGEGAALQGGQRAIAIEKEIAQVDATIESSLYESLRTAGEDPSLAIDVADVFAWDIDFYRDLRRGDRLRLIVEKERVQGQLLRYGDILAVRYVGGLVGDKTYVRYALSTGGEGYFDAQGQSAKKSFLKSPLKYTFITSNYGGRQHPVLGYHKAHQGIDLRAAIGTPVWSVADGTVTRAIKGDKAAGTYLFVRHANGMETTYLHLSRIADGIQVGSRVKQKQIIAYSGNTGRSTGPHLHYGMKRGSSYVNPLSQNFPRAEPLPKAELARFRGQMAALVRQLSFEDDGKGGAVAAAEEEEEP
ncbi:MAG: M23 family metallopeptidase [Myxococcales bacterium]|jgi:murein DD-endopeptidase MepM/ murein hydrolase activator NlpD|nr:M23 family metallopeptidase [Myxococcales bacterium]